MIPPDEQFLATVEPQWIDGNGHMNVAYYMLAFDHAADRSFDRLGIGSDHRRATGHSMFTLDAHLTYEHELRAGETFAITTRLIDLDRKRLHLFQEMRRQDDSRLAATCEALSLHVDLAGPRSAPFPDAAFALAEAMLNAQRTLPLPPQLGRKIGIRR